MLAVREQPETDRGVPGNFTNHALATKPTNVRERMVKVNFEYNSFKKQKHRNLTKEKRRHRERIWNEELNSWIRRPSRRVTCIKHNRQRAHKHMAPSGIKSKLTGKPWLPAFKSRQFWCMKPADWLRTGVETLERQSLPSSAPARRSNDREVGCGRGSHYQP